MPDPTLDDDGFVVPTARGGPLRRRTSIAERRATAARFLMESADEVFDGELDIDWDAEPEADRPWIAPEMISLYGTRIWRNASPRVRADLGRHELVNVLTLVTYAENVASMLEFRQIAEDRTLVDDSARWLFKAINIRTGTMTMFGRLIDMTALPPHVRPRLARRLERQTLLLPGRAVTAAVILLTESAARNAVRLAASDPAVQPHVRMIADIHLMSGARLLRYDQEQFEDHVGRRGSIGRAWTSLVAALLVVGMAGLLSSGDVYRAVGLPRCRARWAARRSASRGRRDHAVFGPGLRVCVRAGLFADPVSRAVLRIGRIDLSALDSSGNQADAERKVPDTDGSEEL